MTLKEYRDKYGLKNADLARKLKVTPSCIHHWISGYAKPSMKNALKIYRKTKKEVTLAGMGVL